MFEAMNGCYRIDLHVHTRRYSPCAELLDPGQLGALMHERGLHGVVLTEHNALWSRDEFMELNGVLRDVRLYRGVEVSCAEGHFIVVGIEAMEGIRSGMSVGRLLASVSRPDVAVIVVHPHEGRSGSATVGAAEALPEGIDAVEVASTITSGMREMQARRLAHARGWGEVAGSDAHAPEFVGEAFTAFPVMPENEQELARLIRQRVGIPMRRQPVRWPERAGVKS